MSTTTKKVVATKQKSVKKPATKKVVATGKKTTTKKASTGKPLVYADDLHSFWVSDGQILNSLKALQSALSTMEKDVYNYHVSKKRHDFAEWVKVVLCDDACAKDLQKAKTPASAKLVVTKHLKQYLP